MEDEISEKWNDLFLSQISKSDKKKKIIEVDKISSYIFIFDCFDNSILYSNSAFKTITGFEKVTIELLLELIHPDDLAYFFEQERKSLDFTNNLRFNDHFKYTLSYTYRIRTVSGSYVRILQEAQAIEVNNNGYLTKTFVTHKIIPFTDQRKTDDYKIFDKSLGLYIDAINNFSLSKREVEILKLIKSGHSSQEIAELLHVSINTVLTHRKNILNKSNSRSFIELFRKLSYRL